MNLSNYKIIDNDYAVGGQKNIILAKHDLFGKVVIKRGNYHDIPSLERIRREVESLKNINSPYFPKQFSFEVNWEKEEFTIIEEFIDGSCLTYKKDQFKTPLEILSLIKDIVIKMTLLWEKNIVHRDIKPDNIIINKNNDPCIIDLGIAKFMNLESLTNTLQLMGPCTPIYAAPEQLTNRKDLIDQRTDFFQIGLLALELYLGEHPYSAKLVGNKDSILANIVNGKYKDSSIDIAKNDSISTLARKTLNPQPYKRIRNPEKLLSLINKLIKNESIASTRL